MRTLIASRRAELDHNVSIRRNQGFETASGLILKGMGMERTSMQVGSKIKPHESPSCLFRVIPIPAQQLLH
jgi:hypothetical protein